MSLIPPLFFLLALYGLARFARARYRWHLADERQTREALAAFALIRDMAPIPALRPSVPFGGFDIHVSKLVPDRTAYLIQRDYAVSLMVLNPKSAALITSVQ